MLIFTSLTSNKLYFVKKFLILKKKQILNSMLSTINRTLRSYDNFGVPITLNMNK